MDLILWRHAEAEDGLPDMDRALTAKGRRQAAAMAAWLRPRLPGKLRILSSPALRARQTADALGMEYRIIDSIAPGADPAALLAAAGWRDASSAVLLVGHQPSLGGVASMLLCSERGDMSIRKGGVVWLSNRACGETSQARVRAILGPDLIEPG